MVSLISIPAAVMAGIVLYVSLYHLLIYVRQPSRREHLVFALLCLVIATYDVLCAGLYSVSSAAEGVRWQRGQSITLVIGGLSFLWFVSAYTRATWRRVDWGFTVFYVLVVLVMLFERSGLTWSDMPAVKVVRIPFGPSFTYYEMASGPLTDLMGLVGLVLYTYSTVATVRMYRRGERRQAALLLLALALFFVGVFNDSAVASGLYQSVYVIEYSYMAMVLLMAYSLSADVVQAASAIEALRQSEERYRSLTESQGEGVGIVDTENRFTLANPAAHELFGVEPGTLVGRSLSEFVDQATFDYLRSLTDPRRAQERNVYELQITRGDGERRSLWVTTTPQLDRAGRYLGALGVFRDITEREQAEAALRESEARLRAIGDNLPMGLIFQLRVDPDGSNRFTYVGGAVERLHECTAEEVMADPSKLFDRVVEEDLEGMRLATERAIREMSVYDHEVRVRRKSGEIRWHRHISKPRMGPDGSVVFDGIDVDVTVQRQAEEALRASEAKFRNIIESIPLGMHMYTLEPDGRLVFSDANPAADMLLGIDNSQFVGKTIEEAFPPLAETEIPDRYREAAGEGKSWWTEQVEYKDEQIVGAFEVYAFRTSPGQMVAAFLNVTDRLKAREDLRRERDVVRRIVETSPAGIVFVDRGGEVTFANTRAEQVLGLSKDTVEQMAYNSPEWRITDYDGNPFPDDDLPFVRVMATGETVHDVRHAIEWPDGSRVLLSINAAPLIDEGGRASGMVATVENVTERVVAERKILQLQHLLQNITDSMPSAIITLDLEGEVLLWNPAAEALFGMSAEQMHGESLWQKYPELTRYREAFDRALDERRVINLHRDPVDSAEGQVYRDISVFPLIANDINGVGLCIDDVTRRVQLEEMMLQSSKMASIGGLAAGVAHEINNPLGIIMQCAQMLQIGLDTERDRTRERLQDSGIDPDALADYMSARDLPDYLEGIRTTSERAAKIVADLLSFSRKSASKVAPHELNTLVSDTIELAAADYDLKKKYDFRSLEVVCDFAGDMPSLMCDGQQIQQVVLNLVRNATQAMAEGVREGESPHLLLRTQKRGRWLRLEVEDNGPGLPESVRARLFEPFFTTKEVGEGTGLGLWLCWAIVVERHKGRISAEDVRGGGARFVVELPLDKEIIDL